MKKTIKKTFELRDITRVSDLRRVVGGTMSDVKVRGWDPNQKKEIVGR